MAAEVKGWDGEVVRKWLESRFKASQLDQDWANRHGPERRDDSDKAAAEEWVCRLTKSSATTNDQDGLMKWLQELIDKDQFHCVGVHKSVSITGGGLSEKSDLTSESY